MTTLAEVSKCIHSLQWRFENSKSCPFCRIAELEDKLEQAIYWENSVRLWAPEVAQVADEEAIK